MDKQRRLGASRHGRGIAATRSQLCAYILLVLLLLYGCTPAEPGAPTALPIAPVQPVPSATIAASPTIPRPTAALQNGVYRDPAGVFVLELPAGWSVVDASTPDAAQAEILPPADSVAGVIVSVQQISALGPNFDEAADVFVRQFTASGQATEEQRSIEAGQIDLRYRIDTGRSVNTLRLRFVEAGERIAILVFSAPADLYPALEPGFEQIAAGFSVSGAGSP